MGSEANTEPPGASVHPSVSGDNTQILIIKNIVKMKELIPMKCLQQCLAFDGVM